VAIVHAEHTTPGIHAPTATDRRALGADELEQLAESVAHLAADRREHPEPPHVATAAARVIAT